MNVFRTERGGKSSGLGAHARSAPMPDAIVAERRREREKRVKPEVAFEVPK
jgi:hypothetical protein